MTRTLLAGIFLLAGISGAAMAQHMTVQSEAQGRAIEVGADMTKPPGTGPFPAVILLPGCAQTEDTGLPVWAAMFHQWGYATIYDHTLRARGLATVCMDDGIKTPIASDVATDVYRLAAAAAADPGIRADKIAVLGRSFGSITVVNFVATDAPRTTSLRNEVVVRGAKIVGGIAISSACFTRQRIILPLLILTGALDDWTSPQRCLELARLNPDSVQIKVYPDAYHGFDGPGPPGAIGGHRYEYNAADAQDAYTTAHSFLERLLR